ncbi:hypothetical protein [Phenylobacterium sp.]|jgi:hypothetical protein|uniref:hypothetical protein n=1 Tax=Phenylobacterium sp. TaxID=1871053 RepID=UPI0035ADCD22
MRGLAVALAVCVGLLAACAPKAPAGVDKNVLDEAISQAIGDPGTCVLIGENGQTIYQYGTHMVCGRVLPSCEGEGTQTLADLLKTAPASGDPKTASCRSNPERTRIVAWAAGPVAGRDYVYAAVMEGDLVPPGIVVADKLRIAFQRAGLSSK